MIDQEQLVTEHADYLLSFAFSKLRDEELAKDMVQDTFLAAIKNYAEFEQRSSLRTWLTSILNRKIIDYWRKAETRYTSNISNLSKTSDSPNLEEYIGITEDNAESIMEKAELIQQLNDCIDKLPPKWKAAISLRYLEEKKSDEVCKELSLSASNLWVIIHRAKLLLKDCLTSGKS